MDMLAKVLHPEQTNLEGSTMKKSAAAVPFAEQKSFAEELDRRVAQRTAELTAANEQLRKELAEHKRAEEALREGELNFNLIVNSIPAPVAVTSPSGEVEALNQPTLEYFGKTFEELKGWKSSDVVHPDDLQRTVAAQVEAHKTGRAYNVESRHRRADGVYRWFNVLGLPLRDTQGHILRWFILQIDIDDRKRAEAQLAGEKRLLEMVASGHALTDILTELCKFVEETAGDCKCGVYLIDWRTANFRLGAAPSLPATFNDPVEGLTVTSDAGPCAVAALTKSQVIVTDVESDPRFQSATIRPLLLAHGLRSHWSTPIYSRNGQVLGTFAIFQNNPSSPTQLQQDLIGQVTYIASIAIERALSEEALKRSEGELKLIIDTIPAMAWSAGKDGTAEFFNQHYLDFMGLSAEQASGWGWTSAIHPDDLDSLAAAWASIMTSEAPGEAEARLRKHDGEYRWFLFRANPLRDDSGSIVKWYGTNTDIDDRKRAEAQRDCTIEELQAQQELLDLAQKSARAMAFDWYIQQEVNVWSPEQESLYGLPPGSFDGTYQRWKKLVYAPDWHILLKAINHANETGVVAVEFRVVWPDGSLHWLATNGQMFFDDKDQPFRMVGFTSDVTPRKLAEEDLRRSEAFLAEAQHLSLIGSFSWRLATDEITWSEQLYRIYELEVGVPVTLELIRTRVHPEDLTLYEKMVEQARNGGDDFEWQYRLMMPDRTIKYLHAVAHATRDQDGELEYIAAVQDVTERQLSEEALGNLRSELAHVSRVATLGALTASIAHEVNQPLSGIITNASTCQRMLNADPPNVDGALETTRRTIRDGNRASEVITRLRALFGKKDAATEAVDLNEATREVIALSLSELQRGRVLLRIELTDDLPPVTGDRVQLQQVILNLLLNASDAMSAVNDRPRELIISTERDDADRVRLSVKDAGVGFEPQAADRLFQAFYTTKDDGMGIGLSVSRSIIESHHGRLWATSNDGPGATFSFSIPCGPMV
jgi:PAS domain S-box-containing protein